MSAELHLFVPRGRAVERAAWQAAIARIGLDVELDPALDVARSRGYSPTRVRGQASGFEIQVDDAASLVAEYPSVRARVADCDRAVTLRWGGDLAECAAALAAAAGLVRACGALAYMPDEDLVCDEEQLVGDFHACFE